MAVGVIAANSFLVRGSKGAEFRRVRRDFPDTLLIVHPMQSQGCCVGNQSSQDSVPASSLAFAIHDIIYCFKFLIVVPGVRNYSAWGCNAFDFCVTQVINATLSSSVSHTLFSISAG